jgi:hypothetical protein
VTGRSRCTAAWSAALVCALSAAPLTGARAADAPPAITAPVLDAEHGLAQGWMDFGYSPHALAKGAPAQLDLSNYGGLILARPGLNGAFGGIALRYKAPAGFPDDFLQVQLQGPDGAKLGQARVNAKDGVQRPDGFTAIWLPMSELNPAGKRFERIMLNAWRSVGPERVLLDGVGLTAPAPVKLQPARAARYALDCKASGTAISPLIYGIGGAGEAPWTLGATARRWGGNPTTRYNFETSTWNTGKDWFFRNGSDPGGYARFLTENLRHGVKSALTIPMLGWVAKDGTSYSFPVEKFGPQQATAPELPDAGNGVGRDGKLIHPGPPTRTSVRSTPEDIERWVRLIRERDKARGRSVQSYILDNEPMLWNSTHRDVHPEPATYDELLEKTLAYAAAIRRADPEAVIAGPAEWGWLGYHYSAKDTAAGVALRPDRRLHGDVPLLPWLLRKIREHERKTGSRVLDVVDVHFYPMANGLGIGPGGDTDPATAALRIRATRSLWDPIYVDESWINEKMAVIPLLHRWIDENRPGLGISIGEWNFGAETHMSGGLAAAEVLGRFGTEQVTSAYYWTDPQKDSPAFWAFRAYRNFDGQGGHFLDVSVPVRTHGYSTSLFASRDAGRRHVVAVLLNFEPASPIDGRVAVEGCGPVSAVRAFTYAGGSGFEKREAALEGGTVVASVPPYSITVLDLDLAPAAPAPAPTAPPAPKAQPK